MAAVPHTAVRVGRTHTLVVGANEQPRDAKHLADLLSAAERPPLLMIHGYGAAAPFWFRNVSELAASGRMVLAVDLLGFGRSERAAFPNSTDDKLADALAAERFFLDELEAFRAALGIDNRKISLLGHSLGAYLSAIHAMEAAESIEQLVLASPVGIPAAPPGGMVGRNRAMRMLIKLWERGATPQQLVRVAGPKGQQLVKRAVGARFGSLADVDKDALAEYTFHASVARASGERALNSILSPGAFARRPLVDRFDTLPKSLPVLFVYGSHDWMDVSAGRHVSRSAPDWHVEIVDSAGHQLAIEQPAEFNRIVGNFLDHGLPSRTLIRRKVRTRRTKVDGFTKM
eukprot:TRINITY_DN1485_c0_g2_i3.p1 TRINITY_DN1485_c0_g2~~TRINITY_DN1485_c0_g2_i3.p1  ORF type:complete len:344 (-),score=119.59 TRINITY_DN1485_c0_g2_i3:27-1058(-)